MKKLFQRTVFVVAAVGLVGCVKVNILPQDTVKNSIAAGKTIYDETKLKRDGGKKRVYSKQVVVTEYANKTEAEETCIAALKTKLTDESIVREAVVTTERVIVVDGFANNTIECQITGFVWPQKKQKELEEPQEQEAQEEQQS